jgi:hypothetical protein
VRENGGALSSGDRARLTDQLCQSRLNECAVALAAWLHDDRRSPELHRRIGEVRKHFRTQEPPLSGPFLRRISGFFAVEGGDLPPATPQVARQETRLFAQYYFPGMPFERRYLARLFDRCTADLENTPRCLEEREKAERRLGWLGGELGS